MKNIKTLIKLSKQQLDEKRQELNELEKQQDQLNEYSAKMTKELVKELKFATDNPGMSMTFDNYRKMINERQENIKLALTDIGGQIENISEQITELFGEMKKYEILLDRKIIKQVKDEKRKETIEMDEVATRAFLQEE